MSMRFVPYPQYATPGRSSAFAQDSLCKTCYDVLSANDSAVQVLGDETLSRIARELVTVVRSNATIDWTMKESVWAKLRAMVQRLLIAPRLSAGQARRCGAPGAGAGRGRGQRVAGPRVSPAK